MGEEKEREMTHPFRYISWGCGVQSTTLAVLSALGLLPRVDAVITADTQNEQSQTYEVRAFYIDWLRGEGIPVEIVTRGNILEMGAEEHVHIPFWTSSGGPLRRQCSREFKIRPIRRKVRSLLGFPLGRPPHPPPGAAECWIGFSLDEWERVKDSELQYIVNRHPLIECKMTRTDCIDFLEARGLPVPIPSACVICPYRLPSGWSEMRDNSPEDFRQAVAFDEANRHNPLAEHGASNADELYIYKYGGPLAAAPLEKDSQRERKGKQLTLFACNDGCFT